MTPSADDRGLGPPLALSAARDRLDGTLAILGTQESFTVLSTALCACGEGAFLELVPPGTDRPLLDPLARLELTEREGGVSVSFHADVAVLTGSAENLAALAAFIDEFLEESDLAEPGVHTHWPWDGDGPGGDQITLAGRIAG